MAERESAEQASSAAREAKLERMTRRLVAIACLATGVFVGWTAGSATAAAKVPKAVQANLFVLTDSDGKVRGQWSIDDEGNARLVLYGSDGKIKVELPSEPRAFPAAR